MLQDTVLRLGGVTRIQSPLLICNEEHRFMVAEQMRGIDCIPKGILLEPMAKNTAPAVALAALTVAPGDILLVLPADHVIADTEAFQAALSIAAERAGQGELVTFGIVPDSAETGYGYIRAEPQSKPQSSVARVDSFVEKPDLLTAQAYLDNGNYYWNSGMFAFKAAAYLDELGKWRPDILAACEKAVGDIRNDQDFCRIDSAAFAQCPSESIDYAVMERTDKAVVIPLQAGWSDVGSWSALWELSSHDEQGNSVRGDVLAVDTHGSYLHARSRLVATVGVQDMIVVETDDAVLVAHKERVQDVKEIVRQLKENHRGEADNHRKVFRPWGYYDSIAQNHRYQAKRIVVNSGAKLSLQKHHHRAEHWVVVQGTASVTRGEEELTLEVNQSTYIPVGMVHCLENRGAEPLELIEVQTGDYLGEDDIVRLEDRYGRVDKK
jgi:mannose-1-phosphate guanylyltransferase/mannose-1-phosphate guanylyltransferase/mannose-6-phosphate isomerase